MNIANLPTQIASAADNARVVDSVNNAITGPVDPVTDGGFGALGQGDFLSLMIAQLQQQDPFEPVDNKDMLAQMAQFSGLAGTTETNETLGDIAAKLDALIAAQAPRGFPVNTPSTPADAADTTKEPQT